MMIINAILAISLFSSIANCWSFGNYDNEDVPEIEKPHFWTACNKEKEICKNYGFEYVDSYKKGIKSRSSCNVGKRVRCAAPDALPLVNTSANSLKVMTYNLFERSFYISHDGQRERSCRVPHWIIKNQPDVDVIAFQECFMGGCWHNQVTIRDVLSYYGFKYQTQTVTDTKHIDVGGMFIASRWPIIETNDFVFENSNLKTFDFLASKGASYAKIEKTVDGVSKRYNVISTHLNAGYAPKPRELQANEIHEFILSLKIPKDEPFLIAGDLNTNLFDVDDIAQLLKELHAHILPIAWNQSLAFTINPDTNDVSKKMGINGDKDYQWLDYVLHVSGFEAPKSMKMYAVAPKSDEAFPVCWCEQCVVKLLTGYLYPDDLICPNTANFQYLSDHDAIVAELVF